MSEDNGRLRVTLSTLASRLVLEEINRRFADAERWGRLIEVLSEAEDIVDIPPGILDAADRRQQMPLGIEALVNASIELSYGDYDEQERVDLLCEIAG
jgi:hypothetical protein